MPPLSLEILYFPWPFFCLAQNNNFRSSLKNPVWLRRLLRPLTRFMVLSRFTVLSLSSLASFTPSLTLHDNMTDLYIYQILSSPHLSPNTSEVRRLTDER